MSVALPRLLEQPRAYGGALIRARVKVLPEDFRVVEDLGFELDGAGEHLYVQLRKRDLNTQDVVERLQRKLGLKPVDIGVAGLKDRRAIADQWVSLRGVSDEVARRAIATLFDDRSCAMPPLSVLQSVRHGRKLRRGAHRGNRFEIILHDVAAAGRLAGEGDCSPGTAAPSPTIAGTRPPWRDALAARMQQLARHGFPNYFGAQRFGIGGRNLEAAQRYFASGGRQRLARQRRGLLLSSARSALFNQVCAERVQAGTWLTPFSGEPLMLAGTQSYFLEGTRPDGSFSEPTQEARQRVLEGDVHTSGPLWGRGEPIAAGACLDLEQTALADQAVFREGLAAAGLEMHRRPLRCRPSGLALDWLDDDTLRMSLGLPKGVFATSLLAELVVETDS